VTVCGDGTLKNLRLNEVLGQGPDPVELGSLKEKELAISMHTEKRPREDKERCPSAGQRASSDPDLRLPASRIKKINVSCLSLLT
jgi:hypothetical protein